MSGVVEGVEEENAADMDLVLGLGQGGSVTSLENPVPGKHRLIYQEGIFEKLGLENRQSAALTALRVLGGG